MTEILWRPGQQSVAKANISVFREDFNRRYKLKLHDWSVTNPEALKLFRDLPQLSD